MVTDTPLPYSSLRREIAERLCSFFATSGDGRASSPDSGAAIASSQGPHRDRNEDRGAIVRFRFGAVRPDLRLGILCDGMGGMAGGGDAAGLAISSFIAAFATIEISCPLNERLERACLFANREVFGTFNGAAGTTLTAIGFSNHAMYAVHVGDSRLYGIDEHRGIKLFTQDDTVSGAVNAHLGQAAEDEMDNRLLQFVGIGEDINPHLVEMADRSLQFWLLTSDGAHGVGRRALSGICEGSRSPIDLVRKLIYVAEALNTQDNATALCIRSGYVKSQEEEHEGLTLQVTTADKGLEIWLPRSAMQIAETKSFDSINDVKETSRRSEPVLAERADRQPARNRRTPGTSRKRKPKQSSKSADTIQSPMDLVFQVGNNDD